MNELATGWMKIGLLFVAMMGAMGVLCWFGLWKLRVDHHVKLLTGVAVAVEGMGGEAGAIASAALKEIREEYEE